MKVAFNLRMCRKSDIDQYTKSYTTILNLCRSEKKTHYDDVIMTTMASQITSLTIVYSIVYSGADQRKHQSSAPLAFVRGIHGGPVNSPHKWPVTRKYFHLMTSSWVVLIDSLSNRGRDKMAAIVLKLSNSFSRIKFHV